MSAVLYMIIEMLLFQNTLISRPPPPLQGLSQLIFLFPTECNNKLP